MRQHEKLICLGYGSANLPLHIARHHYWLPMCFLLLSTLGCGDVSVPGSSASSSDAYPGLQLQVIRLSTNKETNVVTLREELENTSQRTVYVVKLAIDRSTCTIMDRQEVTDAHQSTRYGEQIEGLGFSGIHWHSSGKLPAKALGPGEKLLCAPYTVTLPKGKVYCLETKWTVLCGNERNELSNNVFCSSIDVEIK